MLDIIPITAIPAKQTNIDRGWSLPILAAVNRRQATKRLNKAQIILVVDDDKPTPLGFEKGVGNLLPEMPCTKCGTVLAKKAPAKKPAR
jgi:hypothetical protein